MGLLPRLSFCYRKKQAKTVLKQHAKMSFSKSYCSPTHLNIPLQKKCPCFRLRFVSDLEQEDRSIWHWPSQANWRPDGFWQAKNESGTLLSPVVICFPDFWLQAHGRWSSRLEMGKAWRNKSLWYGKQAKWTMPKSTSQDALKPYFPINPMSNRGAHRNWKNVCFFS